jgi:hypothetical protein
MKLLIYLAGFLILFATAFGLKDYFKAKKQGTLVNYNEPPKPAPDVNVLNKVKEEPIETDTAITIVNKKIKVEKKIRVSSDTAVDHPKKLRLKPEMFSRGRID